MARAVDQVTCGCGPGGMRLGGAGLGIRGHVIGGCEPGATWLGDWTSCTWSGEMDHAPCGQGSRPDAHDGGTADQVPNGCKAGITFSVVASQLPVQGHLQQAPEKYEHERVGQKKYPQQA